MRFFPVLIAALLCASPALAADKRVLRIDSLTASQKDGAILVQAKGAVSSGGWTKPHLHLMHGDGHSIALEFLAASPPPGMTVIDALVPVTATLSIKGRATSIHVLAEENEITSQVVK
ncbi:MAG: hypothetical protein H0U98_08240 [Alphaproteobacteria bacterium]|nr:hypothetical protein [Alphaproteobacteria bacterium]